MVRVGFLMAVALLLMTSVLGLRHTCPSKQPSCPLLTTFEGESVTSSPSEPSESEADWPSMAARLFNAINAAQISLLLLAFALQLLPCHHGVPPEEPFRFNWIAAARQSRAPPACS